MLTSRLSRLLNWLLPAQCVFCGYRLTHSTGISLTKENSVKIAEFAEDICPSCRLDLPVLPLGCAICGHFGKTIFCGSCISNPPPYRLTHALFSYEWPITHIITQLKFHHQLYFAKRLGEWLAKQIVSVWYKDLPLPDLIVPIPLHAKRLKERGFNQSLEIAKPIAKALKIPIDYTGVRRHQPTLAQSGLSATKRKDNMANAFSSHQLYTGRHIALLDDVITTGVTVRECSRLLKKQGALLIDVWCCARR